MEKEKQLDLKEFDPKEYVRKEIKNMVGKIGDGTLSQGINEAFHDDLDKNFLNILAAKFHAQVINEKAEKNEIKNIFSEVMEKTDKYLKLSGKDRTYYHKTNSEFDYLFN